MIINIKQKERVTKSLDSMYDTFCDLECETTDEAKQCVYKQHYNNLRYIKLYVEELHGEIDRLNELLKEQPQIVRCKECKHRPEVKKYVRFGREEEYYVFPEGSKCPCQCSGDDYYSYCPDDNWFCADGEPKECD